jgi:hypothetical protein
MSVEKPSPAALEEFRYFVLKQADRPLPVHFQVSDLARMFGIEINHVWECLFDMADARLIDMRKWNGDEPLEYNRWPDRRTFRESTLDWGYLRLKTKIAAAEVLSDLPNDKLRFAR